jgi:hypothetical protein
MGSVYAPKNRNLLGEEFGTAHEQHCQELIIPQGNGLRPEHSGRILVWKPLDTLGQKGGFIFKG